MVLAFILLLLLAIWAAFKFGGVRKVEKTPPEDGKEPESKSRSEPDFKGGGGKFGGGGASGSWGDDPADSDKDADGDSHKRH